MKKSRYTEEQIAFALRRGESGTPIVEVCRKMGISKQTYFRCKKKYVGMGIAEVRRLKRLEEENRTVNGCSEPHPLRGRFELLKIGDPPRRAFCSRKKKVYALDGPFPFAVDAAWLDVAPDDKEETFSRLEGETNRKETLMLIDFDGLEIVTIEDDAIIHLADLGDEDNYSLLNMMFWTFNCEGWWIGIRELADPNDAIKFDGLSGYGSREIVLLVQGYEGRGFFIEAAPPWYWRAMMNYEPAMRGRTRSFESVKEDLQRPAAPRQNFDWGDVW